MLAIHSTSATGMSTRQCVAQRSAVSQRLGCVAHGVAHRGRCVVRAAEGDADSELEKRLAKLRTVKGATPYGQSAIAKPVASKEEWKTPTGEKSAKKEREKVVYDYTGETVYYQGSPHRGDLLVNMALGTTLVWLPLTFSSATRAAFVTYKFTDRRLSVSTNAPWKVEQTDIAYQQVKDVITIGRGVGLWGDMVVTLKDGSKVELRSLDKFLELKKYILERRDALCPEEAIARTAGVVTADELMGETVSAGGKKKGFGG